MAVMISYSHKDWERVEPVVKFLEVAGLDTWYDKKNLEPFSNWRQELLRMPRIADAFVPFISGSYVASEMCRMELFLARSFDRPVIPVMLDECWNELDDWEETKHLSRTFMARLGSLRLVGAKFTAEEHIQRVVSSVNQAIGDQENDKKNIYISFPNGCAEYATTLHSRISGDHRNPWIATLNCKIGEDWRRAQVQAMAMSKAHVIVISEDYKAQQQALRAEIITSEALKLPTLCICSPELSANPALMGNIYSGLQNGEQALRRLTERQWCPDAEVESQLVPALDKLILEKSH